MKMFKNSEGSVRVCVCDLLQYFFLENRLRGLESPVKIIVDYGLKTMERTTDTTDCESERKKY